MKRSRSPSTQMETLLSALLEQPGQWFHGYPLMKTTGLRSGTLYPLLARMESQGIVESQWQEPQQPGRPPRHAYRLTRSGRELARSLADGSANVQAALQT